MERMCRLAEVLDEIKVEFLRGHLRKGYGVDLVGLERLDRGVLGLQLADGRHWVARVFSPKRRSLALVESDAAILQFLEKHDFPAERCAVAAPVSVLGDRSIFLTSFISHSRGEAGPDTRRAYGDLLGRLHLLQLPAVDGQLAPEAGSLHHYVPGGGGLQADLKAADAWLASLEDQIPASQRWHYESLRQQIATSDSCRDLPQALIHPDPVPKNFLLADADEPVLIDWTGAGQGPRLASLALLLWSSALEGGGWASYRVDAVVAGYRAHIALEPPELERLESVMRIRPLVFACWRYRHAVRSGHIPDGSEWWWPNDELTRVVADRAAASMRERQ
jgi:hypothetical protein